MPSGICEPYMPEHCPTEICEANLQVWSPMPQSPKATEELDGTLWQCEVRPSAGFATAIRRRLQRRFDKTMD